MTKRVLSFILAAALILGVMPLQARAITWMTASEPCIDFIKQIEGFHAIPYWDYSQWTVGFGTACPEKDLDRYQQEGIPLEEAEELLNLHMAYFNREVNRFMTRYGIQLTQRQFDALLSLCYNMGSAWMYNADHKLVQAIVNGTAGNELAYLWGLHSHAGGVFQQGLFKRRMMEVDLFLNGRYNTKMPVDYGSVTYDSMGGQCEATIQGYDLHLPAKPLPVPTYEGYQFLGWYSQPDGGVLVTDLNGATNGMKLYAHWEKIGIADHIGGTPVDITLVTVKASMLNVRVGPGTSYTIATCVSAGTKLYISAIANRNGPLWGKCDKGWISLAHTNYPMPVQGGQGGNLPSVTLPMGATVMNVAGVLVYKGPHTSYPQCGMLQQNQQIEILEMQEFFGQQWARFDGGWVRAERDLMFHDDKVLLHSFVATVTNAYLNIRNGPGTDYSLAGTLSQGEQVEIFAVTDVNGTLWGRCYKGWISLTYTDFDPSMLPRYRNHTYGAWYTVEAPTCAQMGQERRDCTNCDHYEVREVAPLQHQFGDWYEMVAPIDTQPGLQGRDCQLCGYSETQELPALQQPNIRVFGTVTGCDVLNVRAGAGSDKPWVGTLKKGDRVEIFEQTTVNGKVWGRCQKGWICLTGYVTLEELSEEDASCNIMTVTAYTLNIRAGAGSEYTIVGVLRQGEQVEVLETKEVNGTIWARIDRGWVSLKYLK